MKNIKKYVFTILFVTTLLCVGGVKLSSINANVIKDSVTSENITFNGDYGAYQPAGSGKPFVTVGTSSDKTFQNLVIDNQASKLPNSNDFGTVRTTPITAKIYKNSDYSGRGPLTQDALEQCDGLGMGLDPNTYAAVCEYPNFLNFGPVDESIATFYSNLGYDLSGGETKQGPDRNNIPFQNDFGCYTKGGVSPHSKEYFVGGYTVGLRVIPQMKTITKTIYQVSSLTHGYLHFM